MSTLHVENLKGLSSGGNANKIIVPSDQTLHSVGHVIQVVGNAITTETQTTSTSLVDTGLSVTITPKFNTSKIFITVSNLGISSNTQYVIHKLLRGSTIISTDAAYNHGSNSYWMPTNFAMSFLDSPATTSATTYKTQIRLSNAGDLRYNYFGDGTSASTASITALEIAG